MSSSPAVRGGKRESEIARRSWPWFRLHQVRKARRELAPQLFFQLVSLSSGSLDLIRMIEIVSQGGVNLGEGQVGVSYKNLLRSPAKSNDLTNNKIHRDARAFNP